MAATGSLLPIAKTLGIEAVAAIVLVVVAGMSPGAGTTVLWFVVLLWFLAGIDYYATKKSS